MDDTSKQYSGDLTEESEHENSANITVFVNPTTGGQFSVEISPDETAEELRRKISRRLQTPKERLKVLFKEQVLETKPLKDYKISDGSNVTLLPSVESGFSSTVQGTQQSIIQAIESLSDPQIDDFLSGRLPLTLALRVGDHMMFVQLQLEQSQANAQIGDARPSRSHRSGSSHFRQITQTSQRCLSPRLFADMSAAAPMETSSFLSDDFHGKKSPRSRNHVGPLLAEPVMTGPAPKVPKLTPEQAEAIEADREFLKRVHPISGSLHKSAAFHQHHSAPSSPDELPYAIFDQRFNGLQQVTHDYNQLASHINHYTHSPQPGALHRLVTACSSLEQVVAIPPAASSEPIKLPRTIRENHTQRRTSRKRPSTLPTDAANVPQQLSPKSTFTDTVYHRDVPGTAAFFHDALLHHNLSNFPLPNVLSSAYAKYQASQTQSSRNPQPPTSSSTQGKIKLKHPITTNMLRTSPPTSSSPLMQTITKHQNSSKSDRHHHYHRKSSTTGRLTSGSLSHNSSISGTRVARQMQRLRRLCGSHQQCVAYSSRELASEISSIVHMAKHHSRSDGSSHRKMHKACRECHNRDRPSGSGSSSGNQSASTASRNTGVQASGACIDSFTTHGPGIFSGTFSGSLHPSIQDPDGKPKRDPKTILQILTDLLTATQQYQGQFGNVGLLPQLFKEHFKNESSDLKELNDRTDQPPSTSSSDDVKVEKHQNSCAHILKDKAVRFAPAYQQRNDQRSITRNDNINTEKMNASDNPTKSKLPPPAQYLSSVSTIPIGNIPLPYAPRHSSSRSGRRNSPSHESSKHHRHHHHHVHCRHPHYYKHHGSERCCSSVLNCRRLTKQQMSTNVLNAKRENENNNTKNKMKELMKKMEQQRLRRQNRRSANKTCSKRTASDISEKNIQKIMPEKRSVTSIPDGEIHEASASVETGKVKVPFDDIKDYEIKEVGHESPETVTV